MHHPMVTVTAPNWLSALGSVFQQLGMESGLERLVCERLISGLIILACSFPLVTVPAGLAFLMLALSLSAIGRAISQPPMTSIISMRTEQDNRGTLMGAFQSSAALARILGPLAAGLLYVYSFSAPFILGGLLFLLSALITLGLHNVDAPREPQQA